VTDLYRPIPPLPPTGLGLWVRAVQVWQHLHPKLLLLLAEAASSPSHTKQMIELVKTMYPEWSIEHSCHMWMNLTSEYSSRLTPKEKAALAAGWERIRAWQASEAQRDPQ